MRAVQFFGPGDVRVVDRPDPVLVDGTDANHRALPFESLVFMHLQPLIVLLTPRMWEELS